MKRIVLLAAQATCGLLPKKGALAGAAYDGSDADATEASYTNRGSQETPATSTVGWRQWVLPQSTAASSLLRVGTSNLHKDNQTVRAPSCVAATSHGTSEAHGRGSKIRVIDLPENGRPTVVASVYNLWKTMKDADDNGDDYAALRKDVRVVKYKGPHGRGKVCEFRCKRLHEVWNTENFTYEEAMMILEKVISGLRSFHDGGLTHQGVSAKKVALWTSGGQLRVCLLPCDKTTTLPSAPHDPRKDVDRDYRQVKSLALELFGRIQKPENRELYLDAELNCDTERLELEYGSVGNMVVVTYSMPKVVLGPPKRFASRAWRFLQPLQKTEC